VQTQAPDPPVAPNPTTNEDWARIAINYLIAQGYDPALSDIAIRKYLQSEQLTVSEYALVKIALAKVGAPPMPIPNPAPPPSTPPPTTTPPVTTPPPPPVPSPGQYRYITVTKWPSKHGTLWGIANTAYGNGALYPRIYNANRKGTIRADGRPGMISNPNLIYTGWVLLIP
jgi:nucleoid-associated protein YgaU